MNPDLRRPRAVAAFLLTALLAGLLAGPVSADEPGKNALPRTVAVIHCDYPPVSFWNKTTDTPSGFFVDIMNVVAPRAGLRMSYRCESGWPEMLAAVESGRADLSVLMKSAEREKRVAFTAPVEMTYLSLFARSQSSLDDGALPPGTAVGAIKGSMSFEQLRSRPEIALRAQGSYQEGIFNLLAGRIDLFAGEEFAIRRQAREIGLEERIRKVGKPFREQERGIVVRKDDRELLARLNGALSAFVGSPEYKDIYLKWYGQPAPYWTVRRLLTAGGMVLFSAVCGMAIWRYRSVSKLNRELRQSIAERRQAEAIVQASEARLRQITDNMVDMVGQFDERAVFQYVSPSYERVLGYRPEELIGTSAVDRIHPDDRDEVMRAMEAMLRTSTGSVQFRYRHKDGSYRWLENTGRNIVDGKGGISGSIVGSRDVTERRLAEERLRNSEEMTRSVLDSVDEGFIVVGRDYRILNANRAYCAQANAGVAEEVIGRPCYEVSHRSDRPCHERGEDCAVRRVFATGMPSSATHTHRDAGGQVLYVETRAFPLRNEAGEVVSAIESVTNITEKHLLEQERLKTQKLEAIGTLAGGIAHDFNNLLQGVFGFLSLARLNHDDRRLSLEALEEAEQALHLSVKLTNQLLTFSKGGKPLKAPVLLRPTVESAAKFALSGSRSVFRVAGDEPWVVEADEGQVAQVVQNIVLNADQAMPAGGRIDITLRNVEAPGKDLPQDLAPGKYVEIAVADTGIGIPRDHASRVFDPYFTTKEKGSGLGLATSYSIIRNHGGAIRLESETGRGTTFFLYLPALGAREERPHAAAPAGQEQGRKGRILLMDDEKVIRTVAGQLIRALGHDVDYAEHGEEALVRYREAQENGHPFSAVILDLTVRGGMGGAETMRRLLEMDRGVRAIVSSGYSDDAITSNYTAHGFRAFLKKPYNDSHLRSVLASVMDG